MNKPVQNASEQMSMIDEGRILSLMPDKFFVVSKYVNLIYFQISDTNSTVLHSSDFLPYPQHICLQLFPANHPLLS